MSECDISSFLNLGDLDASQAALLRLSKKTLVILKKTLCVLKKDVTSFSKRRSNFFYNM